MSAKPADDIAPGVYQLRVDALGGDGRVAARLALPFQRAEPGRDLAQGERFTIQPGNSLWRIARRSYGSGTRYALIFAANRDQIADPDLIYPARWSSCLRRIETFALAEHVDQQPQMALAAEQQSDRAGDHGRWRKWSRQRDLAGDRDRLLVGEVPVEPVSRDAAASVRSARRRRCAASMVKGSGPRSPARCRMAPSPRPSTRPVKGTSR